MVRRVDIVWTDDFNGVYIDGTYAFEDHDVDPQKLCEALGIECHHHELDASWFRENYLPEAFEEVPLQAESTVCRACGGEQTYLVWDYRVTKWRPMGCFECSQDSSVVAEREGTTLEQ